VPDFQVSNLAIKTSKLETKAWLIPAQLQGIQQ